jgi:hypothetical protein
MNHELNTADKKKYVSPQITTISLRPEEAVLSHCKIAGGAGPIGSACNLLILPCNSIGS